MASDGYNLTWSNHMEELFLGVHKLRELDAFSDVIFHCDGKTFRAHKMFLAASSSFFQKLFENVPNDKASVIPIIELSSTLLGSILEFIYKGETFVPQETLEAFMTAGRKLGIRGLQVDESVKTETRRESRPSTPSNVPDNAVQEDPKRPRQSLRAKRNPRPQSSVDDALLCKSQKLDESLPVPDAVVYASTGATDVHLPAIDPETAGPSTEAIAGMEEFHDEHDLLVKTEQFDGGEGLEYSNDDAEWGEEEGFEDEGQYEEGDAGQKMFVGRAPGDGDQMPSQIPPEISKDASSKSGDRVVSSAKRVQQLIFIRNYKRHGTYPAHFRGNDSLKRGLRIAAHQFVVDTEGVLYYKRRQKKRSKPAKVEAPRVPSLATLVPEERTNIYSKVIIDEESRRQCLFAAHDNVRTGIGGKRPEGHHPGLGRTYKNLVSAGVFWPGIRADVLKYVGTCTECRSVDGKNPEEKG